MADEKMTLVERLLNPQWVHGPELNSEAVLDKEQTLADMKEAAALLVMRLPCDVRLPPRTTIRKGCTLQTLIVGLLARSNPRPTKTVLEFEGETLELK